MNLIQVAGPRRLGATPATRHIVARMMSVAQAAGDIPADRMPIDGDSEIIWIDDTAGKMAAVAVFFPVGKGRLWLDFLYTDAPLRQRGLARALLKRLTAVAKDRGFKRVLFGTKINNAAMRHLAQRAGFVEDSINLAIELGKDAA